MWLLLFTTLVVTVSTVPIDVLPHCSRTITMEGEIRESDDGTPSKSSALFVMGLHETACVAIENNGSRVVHALEFHRLEQHHPVSGKYQFGIPKITPSCICDCAGGDVHCKIDEYNYKNCTSGSVCYRTYHPVQSNAGCGFGEQKSEVCCQLKIDPFRDWIFTALRLSQPDTVIIFKYSIFDRPFMKWRKSTEEFIEVPMNKGSARFDFKETNRLEISVTGSRPNREVVPGMYFARDGIDAIRSGVQLNDIAGGTDLSKLGWLRYIDGKWVVPNGPVKMKEKYHIDVQDCKAQRYTSTFNGEQLVIQSGENENQNFDLGQAVADDPWIQKASLMDRERVVKVEHAEGIALTVTMITETIPVVLHHASQFDRFTGSIKLDKNSNRYINTTFFGAKGTFVGLIYRDDKKDHVDMAVTVSVDSSQIRDYTTTVTVPSDINSQRYVCFYPMGDEKAQQCKWFKFEAQQLNNFSVAHGWTMNQGNCFNCNERGIDGIIGAFDPRSWLDGINSPQEALTIAVEVVGMGVMILILICLCTKCFIPLAKCSLSVPSSRKK